MSAVPVNSLCQDPPVRDESPCTELVSQNGCVEINCTAKDITELRATWFPCNVCKLDLQINALEIIRKTSFAHLSQLRWLSLGSNRIWKIEPFAFDNLVSLEYLNLEYNHLELTVGSYPPHLFTPLILLKTLRLAHQNSQPSDSYPPDFIFHMAGLQALSVPSVGDILHFSSDFCQLENLSRLEISGSVENITNSSFDTLKCLTLIELSLKNLTSLTRFEQDALRPVSRSLRSFHMERVFIGLQNALKVLRPLNGNDMYEISFDFLAFKDSQAGYGVITGDGILNGHSMAHLKDMCLERLLLITCRIFVIEPSAFGPSRLRNCIKYVDLSDNYIQGTDVGIFRLLTLPNLETVVIFAQRPFTPITDEIRKNRILNTPLESPIPPIELPSENAKQSFEKLGLTSHHTPSKQVDHVKSELSFSNNTLPTTAWEMKGFVYVSKNLRAIIFHIKGSFGHFADKLTVVGAERLETLVCRGCGMCCFTGNISGVDKVKVLDFSYNDFSIAAYGYTASFLSIEKLILSHVNFDTKVMSRDSDRIFQTLIHMKSLDLSSNSLVELSVGTFRNNDKLESLYLGDNIFRSIPFDISLTPRLQYLDLSKNSILQLNVKQRHELDLHSNKVTGFRLELKDNMLSCSCDSIPFVWWLGHTTLLLDNGGNYTCITAQGKISYTSAYRDTRALWRECYGKSSLWLSLVLLALMIIGFLIVVLVSQHSNYLRAAVFRIIDQTFRLETLEDYPIGVFVGYAEADYRFPCLRLLPYLEGLNLTVYVKDRNMLPHQDVATAIMEAIQNSWRVLLVVTEAFLLDDQWSEFTMRSAVYSQCPRNPSKVALVVEERLCNRLPTQLLASVGDENVICLDRLVMCYELRQRLKTLILQN
ncbi:toll-like receptor 7 [Aplysia californica]|uniref:Toll-like receptor 7 n=1 Tax=Aplysia californica TaxID=6500 RepID=A0ABM0JUZ4_APLCA|nr:toll-like receptor 7 [Aplysia californica]